VRKCLAAMLIGTLVLLPEWCLCQEPRTPGEQPANWGATNVVLTVTDVEGATNTISKPVTILRDDQRRCVDGLMVVSGAGEITIPWSCISTVAVCKSNANTLTATVTTTNCLTNAFTVSKNEQILAGQADSFGTLCRFEIPISSVYTIERDAKSDGKAMTPSH
jgi:hypothetical protein